MPKVFINVRDELPPEPFLYWNHAAICRVLKSKGFDFNEPIKRTISADKAIHYYTQGDTSNASKE